MDIEKFKNWLINHGCEILPKTNDFELIRWKGRDTGVLYTTGKFSGPYASDAYFKFSKNREWNGGPVSVGRSNTYKKHKEKLILRDGTKCFLCDKEMADDITLDHLIPLVSGGSNKLSNMALMHESCNFACGAMPLIEKVKLAVQNRVKSQLQFYTLKLDHKP